MVTVAERVDRYAAGLLPGGGAGITWRDHGAIMQNAARPTRDVNKLPPYNSSNGYAQDCA